METNMKKLTICLLLFSMVTQKTIPSSGSGMGGGIAGGILLATIVAEAEVESVESKKQKKIRKQKESQIQQQINNKKFDIKKLQSKIIRLTKEVQQIQENLHKTNDKTANIKKVNEKKETINTYNAAIKADKTSIAILKKELEIL